MYLSELLGVKVDLVMKKALKPHIKQHVLREVVYMSSKEIYFEAETPLKKKIRTTGGYWEFIVKVKHPIMRDKEEEVIQTLKEPDFIRQSRKDPNVYLYYREVGDKFICVVCRHLNGDGFIITTYITDRVKEGEEVWRRS